MPQADSVTRVNTDVCTQKVDVGMPGCLPGCSGKGGVEVLQHAHDVLALAWAPNGKQLASATLDGQIYLWDALEAELQVRAGLYVWPYTQRHLYIAARGCHASD